MQFETNLLLHEQNKLLERIAVALETLASQKDRDTEKKLVVDLGSAIAGIQRKNVVEFEN